MSAMFVSEAWEFKLNVRWTLNAQRFIAKRMATISMASLSVQQYWVVYKVWLHIVSVCYGISTTSPISSWHLRVTNQHWFRKNLKCWWYEWMIEIDAIRGSELHSCIYKSQIVSSYAWCSSHIQVRTRMRRAPGIPVNLRFRTGAICSSMMGPRW